jgi:hypothetical protein
MEEVMSLRSSLEHFVDRPRSSAVLALLLIAMGILFISGLLTISPHRKYFAGHEWLLASLCCALALTFGYCALRGLTQRSEASKK